MSIRKIAAILILIISIAIWAYFFVTTGNPSLHGFLLIAALVPIAFASFYISLLVWNRRKPVAVAMLIPAVVTALWISFFLATFLTTMKLSSIDFLPIAMVLLPVVFASFYISLLVWKRRKLVSVAMLIPTIVTVLWVSFLFTTTSFSVTMFLLTIAFIPIVFGAFYVSPKALAARGWGFAIKKSAKIFLLSILWTIVFGAFVAVAVAVGLFSVLSAPNIMQGLAGATGALAIVAVGAIIYTILIYATIFKITVETTLKEVKKQ